MTRTRLFLIAVLALVSLAQAAPASAGHPHGGGLRRGTVVGGVFVMGPAGWRCAAAPDCATWLDHDCDSRLALNPGLQSVIAPVAALAGTQRNFVVTGLAWADVHVEFWTRDCRPVGERVLLHSATRPGGSTVRIPQGAKWMTAPLVDSSPVRWLLH